MNWRCIAPEEIPAWALQAYADGESKPEVAEHVQRCPYCRELLAPQIQVERQTKQTLYRFDCPSPDDLREMVWRAIPARERRSIADHLAACIPCQAEVQAQAEVLAAAERKGRGHGQPIPLVAAARTVWAQLIPMKLPAAFAMRGRAHEQAMYRAGDTDLVIKVESAEDNLHTVLGQLFGPAASFQGEVVFCDLEGVEITRAALDETGSFVQSGLPPAPWEIHFRLAGDAQSAGIEQEIILVAAGTELTDG